MEKKKLFLYGACACFLLALIMALTKVFFVKMGGESSAGTLGDMNKTWVTVILVILNLGGIALLLLPEFGILPKIPLLRLCAIGAAAVSLILFIIVWIAFGASDEIKAAKELAEYLGNAKISYGPSFSGWLVMIFEAGAGALAFLSGKDK